MAKQTKATNNLPNDAREQLGGLQQASRRSHRHQNAHADYTSVNADILLIAIAAVANQGCAIQFGLTKDGSTFVVRVVGDGDPYNDFIRPSEDFEAYLKALSSDFSHSE